MIRNDYSLPIMNIQTIPENNDAVRSKNFMAGLNRRFPESVGALLGTGDIIGSA